MDTKFKSIISELNEFISPKDRYLIIESRATHVIASTINLISLIKESFPEEESSELVKRLFLSIKNEDQIRFKRGIKRLKEKNNGPKNPKISH